MMLVNIETHSEADELVNLIVGGGSRFLGGGSHNSGGGSHNAGGGSPIRGAGSEIRGAGSETRRDPAEFNHCPAVSLQRLLTSLNFILLFQFSWIKLSLIYLSSLNLLQLCNSHF